jgi:2-amino-4-hydroxy-6-hydroxymethyldihydropteridine diphosphokinase
MPGSVESSWDGAVVIALGSNLGLDDGGASPLALVEAALGRLPGAGFRVVGRSSWWRSAAWPDPAQPDYINGVAIVETSLAPREALDALHAIEADFGRERHERNAARTLDLDLIAHGRTVVEEEGGFILPHPRAADRLFVMGPLAELAPEWRHPISDRTAADLAAEARVGRDARPI